MRMCKRDGGIIKVGERERESEFGFYIRKEYRAKFSLAKN